MRCMTVVLCVYEENKGWKFSNKVVISFLNWVGD